MSATVLLESRETGEPKSILFLTGFFLSVDYLLMQKGIDEV